jgi:hypothetical protein
MKDDAAVRWAKGQRFELSATGELAVDSYRVALASARTVGGRPAFDDACAGWAARHQLLVEDAVGLSEIASESSTLTELVDRLDGYGPTAKSVRATVTRLVERGLVVLAVRRAAQ